MTKDEIRLILDKCLTPVSPALKSPTAREWQLLENRFGCHLPDEMKDFIDLMSEFEFPGDILNVGEGPNNGNDTIELIYDIESRENPDWSEEMIPFYSIGNGDFFCISNLLCPESPIYYYYADRGKFEKYSDSFTAWLLDLPQFLA